MSTSSEFEDPMARPRYTGLATFMRAPYREDPHGVDIGLIGVPFDGGVTNRTGTRHGPREIRNQSSLMRKINQASGIAPYELCTVADFGDAWVQRPFHLESSLDEIARFLPAHPCRRGDPALGRRRPFDLAADPARDRRRAAGRHGAHRRPLRHRLQLSRLQLPSRRAVRARGRGGAARSGAHGPDRYPRQHQRPRRLEVQPRVRACA